MESPVCTPIGSTFSMEQMITQLSAVSRITSNSYSFQPMIDSSINTLFTGLAIKPEFTISLNSSIECAIPPPEPPKVKDGLMIVGNPTVSMSVRASSKELTKPPLGMSRPHLIMAARNNSLSSAILIASTLEPIN